MGVDVAPWDSAKNFESWRLKYLNLTFDEVWERPDHRITFPREFKRYERSNPPFNTPSGKFELFSSLAESLGAEALPVFKEPPQSPVTTPEIFKKFPLMYVQYRIINFTHTEGRQVERQRRITPDPCLEINPKTASELGIGQGDWVYLETPQSEGRYRVQYKARLVPEMHPQVVAGSHGWWFPEKPAPEHGCFDSNINALIPLVPPFDPVEGTPQCRSILCRVGRIEKES
jgi:anaerobic selenocysteine-containing dehydrogenase